MEPDSLITGVRDAHWLLAGRVRGNECTSDDFAAVLDEPGDYWAACDPPFVGQGHKLYRHSFTEAEHRRLARVLRRVGKPFLVTYDDTKLVRDLYEPWAVVDVADIWFGDDRKAATGLLIHRREDAEQVRYQRIGPILDLFGA
ncbi:MAG: hypothetical protein AMXMBFR58_36690 [Phycisphaerae bacterium]